jgi:hypothetical protein
VSTRPHPSSSRPVIRTPIPTAAGALLAALIVIAGAVSPLGVGAAPAASAANWAPVHTGDFPDPSVLYWNGTYYGFATQSFAVNEQITNIQVSTSSDGVNWVPLGTDALPTLPSWAETGDTWAPSVAYDATTSQFVMYYTATEARTGFQCIGVATSSVPTGPYVDTSSTPVVCQNGSDVPPTTIDNGNYGGSIDPDIFTDDAGNSWLIWKSDGNHIGLNTVIWSVPLGANLLSPASTTPTELMADDEPWQSGIVEGPDMVETQSHAYYLFYAGSYEGASTYAIGWASCPSGPASLCADQSTSGPLLASSPGMSGPGGPDVFTLQSSGQLVMAFAAWQGTTIGYLSCGVRPMYLASLTFASAGGPPTLAPYLDTAPASNPSCPGPPRLPPGYWQVGADGGIFSFGSAAFYGSTGSMRLNKPVVGMAATPDGRGYWLVASDGGVFAYGDAGFYGSTGSIVLNKPIIGMVPTADGRGYWLVASDGGVFAYGDAHFYGSAGGAGLAYPVTAAARSFLGGGYWIVDANGQVFSYGDAPFEGQPAFAPGGYRITGMAGTSNYSGYWLASANGNVADFGDAAPYGSEYGAGLNAPIVGMAATGDGAGYWLQGADGGIFAFGDAPYLGSMGGQHLNAPMVGIAST